MSVNIFKTVKYFTLAILLFSSHVNYGLAEQNEALLNFKFSHLSNNSHPKAFSQTTPSFNSDQLAFSQLDATWTYPWEVKNISLDLGLTLRHLSVFKGAIGGNSGASNFHEVLPLLHASALYSLPVEGLSAGIEGSSQVDSNATHIFDYRAKVSYEWRKGFGLQGGWQHQQFKLDGPIDASAGYERTGPFLDLYLKF